METSIIILSIVAATTLAVAARALRQPLLIAYLAAGFLLGPTGLNLLTNAETVHVFAEFGIAFLLFSVGLKMSIGDLKDYGIVSLVAGLGQVLVTGLAGYFIAQALGYTTIAAAYIGIGLAFSSTIIIVRLLEERGELQARNGRISIGFLLVQDILAILALILVAGLQRGGSITSTLTTTLLIATAFIAVITIITRYVLPRLIRPIASTPELLQLIAISYCFLLAVTSQLLGLSIEIGAFVAGISLGTLQYTKHITATIQPIRDFFIVLFFISLGTELSFSLTQSLLIPLLILSLLVLIGNPLILMSIMGVLNYDKRTSFLVGLTVAQISEFSLVLAFLGYDVGHLDQATVSLITAVGVITIATSTYFILYADELYSYLRPVLSIFERRNAARPHDDLDDDLNGHIVIEGSTELVEQLIPTLATDGEVVVIDTDPQRLERVADNATTVYGDPRHPELLNALRLERATLFLAAKPDARTTKELLKTVRDINPGIIFIAVAEQVEEALELYEAGCDHVVLPRLLGGHHASLLLTENRHDAFLSKRTEHIQELRSILESGPEGI